MMLELNDLMHKNKKSIMCSSYFFLILINFEVNFYLNQKEIKTKVRLMKYGRRFYTV